MGISSSIGVILVEALKQRIRLEGKNLGNGILKVDSFINHQVDPAMMLAIGGALAAHFGAMGINKVLTAEISGIAPALTTALALGVPVVYARKTKPVTMPDQVYRETAPSHTKGEYVELMASPEFLGPGDRLLIIDDFLARGKTIDALARLATDAGAEIKGIGTVVEKAFEGGRDELAYLNVPIYSLAVITEMTDDEIVFG
jgi:xanthine phosphoribosyltransferase